MKLRNIVLATLAIMAMSASAQSTTKLTASKANDFGIAYCLPQTVFDIVIETQFSQKQPGEFSNYANRYLNATNAIIDQEFASDIVSINVIPRGVPDENNRWMMEFKGSGLTYVMLDEAGVPIAINTEDINMAELPVLPTAHKAVPTPLETPEAKQAITQEMSMSTSINKRAQLASQRIFELRETRSDLISGNADNTPPDGKSMQLMLDNLAAQEAALNAMFVGTEKTWTDVQTLTYTPTDTEEKDLIIGRISPTQGLVAADDLSGKPIYLSLEILTTGELPTDANGAPKKAPKDGVAYTLPGSALLTITYNGKVLLSREYEIAQLGKTFFLDPKIFTDKKSPSYVTFNPTTGGISTIGTK